MPSHRKKHISKLAFVFLDNFLGEIPITSQKLSVNLFVGVTGKSEGEGARHTTIAFNNIRVIPKGGTPTKLILGLKKASGEGL